MNKTMVAVSAALLATWMAANTQQAIAGSNYDKQFINYPTYSGDDLELKVDASELISASGAQRRRKWCSTFIIPVSTVRLMIACR